MARCVSVLRGARGWPFFKLCAGAPSPYNADRSAGSSLRPRRLRIDMKLLVVVGTRPEAIKMAPVIRRLASERECEVRVCATAQHRQMLDQALGLFGITPDIDLDLMRPDQTLNELAARVFAALDATLAKEAPDWLLVQGDTTTAMCASVAAFHRRVRVGHVEAGLRT